MGGIKSYIGNVYNMEGMISGGEVIWFMVRGIQQFQCSEYHHRESSCDMACLWPR